MPTIPTNEKGNVFRYIGSMFQLNLPFSGDDSLLPEPLCRKGTLLRGTYSKALLQLLGRHGYTFGRPDSLRHNVRQRILDLTEQYLASCGSDRMPAFMDCRCQSINCPSMNFIRTFRMNWAVQTGAGKEDDEMWDVDEVLDLAAPFNELGYFIRQVTAVYDCTYRVEVTERHTERNTGKGSTDRRSRDSYEIRLQDENCVKATREPLESFAIVVQPAPDGPEAVRRVREKYLAGELDGIG